MGRNIGAKPNDSVRYEDLDKNASAISSNEFEGLTLAGTILVAGAVAEFIVGVELDVGGGGGL